MRRALGDGAEVAIAGGGPAGCAFAIGLLAGAQLRGLRLAARIFEGPRATAALPPAVLGPAARQRLAALGVPLSPELCTAQLDAVIVWAGGLEARLELPARSAFVLDGWPAQAPGSVLLQRQLQQAAAL